MFYSSKITQISLALAFVCGALPCIASTEEVAQATTALKEGKVKVAINLYTQALADAPPNQKGEIKTKLAQAYLLDQDTQRAFETFLQALDEAPHKLQAVPGKDEQEIYDQVLKVYLQEGAIQLVEMSHDVLKKALPVVEAHPDYLLVNYLVACAYANLGRFDQFFDRFYQSYQAYPDEFIAYKTRAVLHLKLMERMSLPAERQAHQEAAYNNVVKAIEKKPTDASLYRLLFALAKESEKKQVVVVYLNKMLGQNIVIPRSDILPYVMEAVSLQEYDLAQRVVDSARRSYAYSRVVVAAQEYLDEHSE